MKLSQIRDVLAVAEMGSLRSAGRLLGVGQPTITRSIRDIEHELGAALFERSSKGVFLTAIGATFVRRAATVEQELRRAKEEIRQIRGSSAGQVNLAMSVGASVALAPLVYQQFRRRFPDGLLRTSESSFPLVEPRLHNACIELYVGELDMSATRPALIVERLFDNSHVVLARRGHRLGNCRRLEELIEAEWVQPVHSLAAVDADFESLFVSRGLRAPRVAMQSHSALSTVIAVASTELLAVVPRQWLECSGITTMVHRIALDEPLDADPVCLVRHGSSPLTPMAEHLSDLFRRAGAGYQARQALSFRSHAATGASSVAEFTLRRV